MTPLSAITQTAQSEGRALDINTYKKDRRCKHCKRLLSVYNPGPGCYTHADILRQKEKEAEEKKRVLWCSNVYLKKRKVGRPKGVKNG